MPAKGEKSLKFIALLMPCIICIASISEPVFSQNVMLDKYHGKPQVITRIKIASASVVPDKWDKAANWRRIEMMVRKSVEEGGADVVVTPEGVLEGYVINEVNGEQDGIKKREMIKRFIHLAEPPDGLYIKRACGLADELNIFFVMGFLERREEYLLNTAILIDTEGDIIGKYSKTHFAQGYDVNPSCYIAGEDYPVFETPFGKAGILICYDRQLPEPARILALKGAQILFLPSYGSYTDAHGWNSVLLRTRAYENRYPVVFSHPFQSLLISGNGSIKAMGGASEIVYYEVDTSPEHYTGRFRNRPPSQVEKSEGTGMTGDICSGSAASCAAAMSLGPIPEKGGLRHTI